MLSNTIGPLAKPIESRAFDDHDPLSEYLFTEGLTYLNTGTLGPCRRETIEETQKIWKELETFPVKFYGKWGAEELAEKTRITAARFLGCDVVEMLITTSTTNGMNAIAQGLRLKAGDRILTTDQEHSGGISGWRYFEKYYGVVLDIIAIPPGENNGETILNRLSENIKPETRVISISHVFSSTGLRVPVAEICALAKSKGILSIIDGAQAVGSIQVDVKKIGCDAYATSGHKWLMGPKGTGLLYLSKDAQERIRPIQFEESHNTYNNSNGVVNLPAILGLAKAIEYLESVGMIAVEKHNMFLRHRLYKKLESISKLTIVSPPPGPLSSPLLSCKIPDDIESVAFVRMLLDNHKLSIRPTHKQWFNGIRFSTHIFNTEQEVDYAAEVLKEELGKY